MRIAVAFGAGGASGGRVVSICQELIIALARRPGRTRKFGAVPVLQWRCAINVAKYAETPAALVFLLGGAPARGHHSIAPYDLVHGKVINGAVTNPHAHMDVTGEENVIEH